jgi:hypothetical protein
MKRCPECLFIYPDSDSRCDFDNTPLVVVDEAELDAAANQSPPPPKSKRTPRKRQRKVTAITAAVGLLLGVGAFLVYYSFGQFNHDTPEIAAVATVAPEPIAAPQPAVVSPSPVEVTSPSPSPSATPKPSAERVATSHSATTVTPVSTSGPGMGKKLGGKPVILLTSGGKIEADEVWRTRDGVWYRRAGIVTLLKRGRVKSIVNQ